MYEMEERRSEERFTHRYKKKTCIWIYTADRQTDRDGNVRETSEWRGCRQGRGMSRRAPRSREGGRR